MCSDTETKTEIKKHDHGAAYARFEENAGAVFAPYLKMFNELPLEYSPRILELPLVNNAYPQRS